MSYAAAQVPPGAITGCFGGLGALPAASELGEIVSRDGYRYQITPNDMLWLGRSVKYEGGNRLATAWTYAQRMALFRRWATLAELVQAHSQPVNPIWRRDGSMCRPGGRYHDRDDCAERRLAVRDTAATLPWDSIQSSIRTALTAWAKAERPNVVPKATDFANGPVSRSFITRHPGTEVVMRDDNWYLAEGPHSAPGNGSLGWPSDFVTIRYRGRDAGVSALAGVPRWVPWVVAAGAGTLVLGGVATVALRKR